MPASSTLGAARRALVAGAVLVAVVLVSTAWANFVAVRAASRDVAYAQGMSVIESMRHLAAPGNLTRDELGERLALQLAADRSDGLRYLAVKARELVEVGEPVGDTWVEGRPPRNRFDWFGDRVRIAAPLPPEAMRGPPGHEGREQRAMHGGPPHDGPPNHPPPHDGPHPGPPPHGGPPPGAHAGPPAVVAEFVPLQAHALRERARRGLWLDVGVALALLLCAWVAARWLRAREAEEQQQARQEHLASLGEMSAVLAHELRNPLTALKGHAQLLAESLAADPKAQQKAERVVKEAVRIEDLSRGLLEFVRTGAVDRRPCDPAEPLRAAAAEVDADRVSLDLSNAPPRWSLDRERIQQVLVNLLANAIQAAPPDTAVEASLRVEAGRLIYSVRDRGPGVAPDVAARIFEPFFTTRTRGTGLGLAVAKRIVDQHGGTLTLERPQDGGARFVVRLPEVA
jgi:two-component system sensor histidine kinase HydH